MKTQTPERVTLTAEEREQLRGLPSNSDFLSAVESILADREHALREKIAQQIEATPTAGMVVGYSEALDIAAHIARGDQ